MKKKELDIWLGNNSLGEKAYWDPQAQRSPHLILTGGSGSGKTETLKCICFELKKKGVSTIIIDFHNDFGVLADNLINLENTTIHPLEVQIGEKPIDVQYKIARIFGKIFDLGEIQESNLRGAISKFYEESGIKDPKKVNNGEIKLLPFRHFKEILEKRYELKEVKNLLARLQIVFDTDIFMNAKDTALPFDTMTTEVSVIQLKDFPTDEIKGMISEILMNKLINLFYIKGQSEEGIRLFCVIDEAHRVIYDGSPVDLLLRESRKYGVGVILASQRPVDFSETILSNVGAILSFQCSLAKDARYLAGIISEDHEVLQKVSEPGVCFMKLASENRSRKIKIIRVQDRPEFKNIEKNFNETELRKKAESEITRRKKEQKEKEEYLTLKSNTLPQLLKEVAEINSKCQNMTKKISEYETIENKLKVELQEKQKQLTLNSAELKQIENNIEKLNEHHAMSYGNLQIKLNRKEKEIEELIIENKDMNSSQITLKREITKNEKELAEAKKTITELEDKNHELKLKLLHLKNKMFSNPIVSVFVEEKDF